MSPLSCLCSDAEITAANLPETVQDQQLMAGTNADGSKLKQRSGATQPRPDLKLTAVNVETNNDVELVECLLETAKHASVSFKFSRFTDQPNDVAAYLVSRSPAVCSQIVVPHLVSALLHIHNFIFGSFAVFEVYFSCQ